MKKASALALIATGGMFTIAVAKWSRLPGTENTATNMSMVLSGAMVSKSEGLTDAKGLVSGDGTRGVRLSAGRNQAIIRFSTQAVIETASFVNDGLEGKVEASISADGENWNSFDSSVFTPADRLVKLEAAAVQGGYLKLDIDSVRAGTIRSFKVIGSDNVSMYEVTQSDSDAGPMVNFASGIGGGRLIYINPDAYVLQSESNRFNRMSFPESDEKFRTAVYDLGTVRRLKEFSSVHSARPVRYEVYAFETLPEKEDWRGRLTFDPSAFDRSEPVAKGEDTQGSGNIKVKPDREVKARYVAMRWEPDFNPPAFDVFDSGASGNGQCKYRGNEYGAGNGDGNGDGNGNGNGGNMGGFGPPPPPGPVGGGGGGNGKGKGKGQSKSPSSAN
jgi:hypothetical protein